MCSSDLQNIAEYFRSQFRRIGVDLELRQTPDFPTWARRVGGHEFDMTMDLVFNWGDPVVGVHRTYLTSNIRKGVVWSNTQSYSNPRVDELLAGVGLLDLRHQDVSTLSGGEAKRVALARSLAPSPRVLLLDEPLSGLDVEMRDRLAADLVTVLHDSRTTSILVSHDPAEVEAIAHATYRLPGRPTPT